MNRVDFHAHLLPGVDHGSKDLDTSLKQLQAAKKAGVVTVVTTPHFYSWRQDLTTFLPLREKAFDLMQGYARQVNMQLISAAEVTLSMDLAKLVGLEQLCVGTTNYILIEMPLENWGTWVYDALELIISRRNLRPIIAHVDRYPVKSVLRLLELDVLAQVNAEAFQSIWSGQVYQKWIKAGMVHLLGSDVHDAAAPQYQEFSKALTRLAKLEEQLMSNAHAVLAGESLF
ncbi:MAG TPA: CpsB/CapC family capsule biosynthesis tyrosine phosphatase [Bacillota bacterium]|nr:CpsB/CapC family capsule biosynthesis tyrosine phosphatase [Bacillota bacterium]